jgi:hypothetical protein
MVNMKIMISYRMLSNSLLGEIDMEVSVADTYNGDETTMFHWFNPGVWFFQPFHMIKFEVWSN